MKNFEIKNVDCHATLAMTKNAQNGRSMIEMLGVLAIIGVLSVGGIAGYSKAMTKYRINKAIEQITLIAGNVRTFFASQGNYVGVRCSSNDMTGQCDSGGCVGHNNGCPILKKAKILPDEMITVNAAGRITSITNPFGYGIGLSTANKAKSGDNQAFVLDYNIDGKNLEVCLELASHDWSVAGAKYIWVYDGGPMKGGKITVPGDMDKAFDVCSKAYSNGERKIHIRFYFDVNSNCWDETNGNTCS